MINVRCEMYIDDCIVYGNLFHVHVQFLKDLDYITCF